MNKRFGSVQLRPWRLVDGIVVSSKKTGTKKCHYDSIKAKLKTCKNWIGK